MEIENYRNFLAIIEAGSITGAAEYVHVAQPALSKQLHALEKFYGAKLLVTSRGNRQVFLTEAGRSLYQKAKYICSLEDLAKNEVENIMGGTRGILRISITNSRAEVFITKILKPFVKEFPDVSVEIFEASTLEQGEQLLTGISELGILSTPISNDNDFETLFQRDEDIVVAFAKNSRFLEKINGPSISIEELTKFPISLTSGCAKSFKERCSELDLSPHILSVSTAKHTALQWAVEDTSVALIPFDRQEKAPSSVVIKKISDININLYKSIVKVKHRPLSALALQFVLFYSEHSDSQTLCDIKELFSANFKY